MHQNKIVSWNYVTTVKTCEPQHDKNNIITHSPRAIYFSSIRCSRENALDPWLPIINAQLESRILFKLDGVDIVSPGFVCVCVCVFCVCFFVLRLISKYGFKDQIKDTRIKQNTALFLSIFSLFLSLSLPLSLSLSLSHTLSLSLSFLLCLSPSFLSLSQGDL